MNQHLSHRQLLCQHAASDCRVGTKNNDCLNSMQETCSFVLPSQQSASTCRTEKQSLQSANSPHWRTNDRHSILVSRLERRGPPLWWGHEITVWKRKAFISDATQCVSVDCRNRVRATYIYGAISWPCAENDLYKSPCNDILTQPHQLYFGHILYQAKPSCYRCFSLPAQKRGQQ
jgi:hypothetical protein